ncbi:hypothetical protein FOL47_008591 [Perkinsus chesapeaki]|uniref:Uncharacterized protein n=1 Tax=Perkinsus chesapeaki TaxID=330153 RepID=A0A7J6MTD7_PERCH|nr:hypothetical protein FOL47_008591 [Perkinsus chesapeaki]
MSVPGAPTALSPRSILTSTVASSVSEDSSPRSIRSDRNGREIVPRSKEHSISFADEIPDISGSPQSLETVYPVECYKELNRCDSFEARDTEFPEKRQSCLAGFKEFLYLLFTASDAPDDTYVDFARNAYYV